MFIVIVQDSWVIRSRGLLVRGKLVQGEADTKILPRKVTATIQAEGQPPFVLTNATQNYMFDANLQPDDVLLLCRDTTKDDVPVGARIIVDYI